MTRNWRTGWWMAVGSVLWGCAPASDNGGVPGMVGAGGIGEGAAAVGGADDGNGSGGPPGSGANGPPGLGGGGSGGPGESDDECGTALVVTVRDFTEVHPDFESYLGPQLDGIVLPDLGADGLPVYAHPGPTLCTTGPEEFNQWYRDTPGVNMRVPVSIEFHEPTPGVFVYDNSAFFPIDGMGFGNGPNTTLPFIGEIPAPHNWLFTTEMHTQFTYKGGEVFTFRGDDDLWVFINRKLAIDLGGPHAAMEESIDIDARAQQLGLTVGQTYPMDIFHAERHTTGSNFRIETTIDFSCVVNIPPPS